MKSVARGASLAVLISLMGSAGQAAITADQLWAAWQDAGARAGLTVTAEATNREGSSLRLSGVTISVGSAATPAPSVEAVIDEILLTEAADGSVTVVPSPELSIATGDEVNGAAVVLSHSGGAIIVTENLGELVYDLTAAELAADVSISAVSTISKDDGTAARADYAMTMTLANPAAKVTDTPNANRTFAFNVAADAISYAVQSSDEGLSTSSAQTSTTADVVINGNFAAPKTLALAELSTPQAWSAALAEGMALSVDATQGASESTAKEENAFVPMDLTATGLPGTARFAFSKDGYDVGATGEGLQLVVKSASLPVPEVKVGMGPVEIAIAMPIMSGTMPGDFGVTLKMADVVVSEDFWGMIDPAAQLSRDAAQLSLVAKGTMLIDILALMAAESGGMTEVAPPQPLTLDIPELLVSAAGAMLTGSGAFAFDNATGTPVPAGEANLTLTGGNKLIDGLIAIGMLTEEDAGGARMMMSMFMNSTGDDVLTSRIEAKADGSISVNGQRIQ